MRTAFGAGARVPDGLAVAVAVAVAVAGVSALGPSMDRKATGPPLVEGTGHILTAMKRHGVRRYLGHATPGVLDPREKPTPVTRLIAFMPRTFMRRAYDEITGMTGRGHALGPGPARRALPRPREHPRQARLRVGFFGADKLGFAVGRAPALSN
ncbi:hypothetical protein [Streptomyces globisporus]|uniref:hypothetical protein n=1 Tax=Streptomyces globisporus TaxID=1908 RepID=UPI00190201D1|nr:hypothetical protein [Streptomyces globisporus]